MTRLVTFPKMQSQGAGFGWRFRSLPLGPAHAKCVGPSGTERTHLFASHLAPVTCEVDLVQQSMA